MALSLVSSAHSSYSDLQSFFDNSRLGFDFSTTFHDQMEYNNLQNTHPQRNYSDGHQQVTTNITKGFNDYDQVINFVDSPPNSKESWSEDQNSNSPRIIDVQTIYSNNGNRKRRMDWDPLEISHSANNNTSTNSNINPRVHNSSPPKIPNINHASQNTQQQPSSGSTDPQQQRDRSNSNNDNKKKQSSGSGRGNWSDDIDFGEFDNSSYLNSEAFLSFNAPLGLKQEIPSPQTPPSKLSNKSPQGHVIGSPDNGHNKNDQQDQNLPVNTSQNKRYDGDKEKSGSGGVGGGFQQLLPSAAATDNTSVQSSPRPIPESPANSDLPADDFKFQYILAAATSIATKNNEETLTYLNQGQSYEIKLKKTGDLSFYRDKILKSVIKICFHERRLQYMERAQMQQWQASRPGERIIEVDVPLSYGLCSAYQPTNCNQSNTVEVFWDPMKEVGVYIKVNCISTEFTPKKHGGEKGVPFRIQIETYIENSVGGDNNNTGNFSTGGNNNPTTNGNTNSNQSVNSNNKLAAIHAAACQIKVFKLKGADRKHKQDKEKIQRRPQSEQDKYQPSYECTILNDISLDSLNSTPGCYSPEYFGKLWPNSPVHITKYDGLFQTVPTTSNSSPIAINCVTSTNTSNLKIMDCNMVSPQQIEMDECIPTISKDSPPGQVAQWLIYHRLNAYLSTFAQFLGADIYRMTKEDLIQICGLADGIRMYNILHANQETKRTIYISIDGSSFHAVYLKTANVKELVQKLMKLPGFFELCANFPNINGNGDGSIFSYGMQSKYSGSGSNMYDGAKVTIYISGPSGVHVLVTDEVLINEIEDKSPYALEVQNGKVLMKLIKKLEN